MTELTMNHLNVTLDIGNEGKPDAARVNLNVRTNSITFGLGLPVSLPAGSIVKGPVEAEHLAKAKAADILDEVAAYLRTEAAK